MSEIEALQAVDSALGALEPAERALLSWVQQKYGAPGQVSPPTPQQAAAPAQMFPLAKTPADGAKAKASKKTKTIISMDKNFNLNLAVRLRRFNVATEKSPSTVLQKCVVAVYYLRDTIEMEKVTAQAVFTFFKNLSWPVPTDLKNTLQQAGTAGWLDTADGEDIKLTSLGENLR